MVLRKLKSLFKRGKPKEPVATTTDLPSLEDSFVGGRILFQYDSLTGELMTLLDIQDASDVSAELFARILVALEAGDLSNYVYSAIAAWADTSQKLLFTEKVIDRIKELQNDGSEPKLAIDPSRVFNFRSDAK